MKIEIHIRGAGHVGVVSVSAVPQLGELIADPRAGEEARLMVVGRAFNLGRVKVQTTQVSVGQGVAA